VRRLEADDAAAGGRNPDGTRGVRPERRIGEAGRERRGGAAARPAGIAVGRERIPDIPEMLVLRGDAVGELVQVRLADDRIACSLEASDRRGGPVRNMLREDRRAVGRPEACRVEEILDAEADPVAGLLDLGDEGVQARLSTRRARSRRR
jgi:hypothetical protein